MSDFTPYDAYEPNEPRLQDAASGGRKPLAPAGAWAPAKASSRKAAALGDPAHPEGMALDEPAWNEADYLPNDPPAAPPRRAAAARPAIAQDAQAEPARENPYARLTWDETAYAEPASPQGRRGRASAYDAPIAEDSASMAPAASARSANPYARPPADAPDGLPDLSARFAPPLKFELPKRLYDEPEEAVFAPPGQPNVYQTRRPAVPAAENLAYDPTPRGDAYRVEADDQSLRRRRRLRALRRTGIVLLLLALLGGAAYWNREWLLAQVGTLFGKEAAETVHQAIGVQAQTPVKGYDAAPALQAGDGAKRGINAVAGNLALEPYAVTEHNVVARRPMADGTFEYYLFAAQNGQLLGYYEGIQDNGFSVCPDDVFYVQESPYLIDSQGLPLIDAARYQQAAGADAALGPMIGGWSVIHDQVDHCYNFINAQGNLLSPLWFAKVFPFTGSMTLAYVDTGNVTVPEERYALYTLSRSGEMKLWQHAADMEGVAGAAAGMALMASGDLVRLETTPVTLCQSDDVTVYADCGAVVARDRQTGKYGLFVGGEQQYDFAYDTIAPVAQDIAWSGSTQGAFRLLAVSGMPYPLPLSHYFALTRDGAQEMVALSTMSVYPLLLE